MRTYFHNKKITSMLGIMPSFVSYFDDEVNNYTFPPKQTMMLKKIMGFNKHHLSKPESSVADFAIFGLQYMLNHQWITKDEIGAIVVVSVCPDFFMPHISNIVQGSLNLSNEVVCLDIAQGCSGFLVGLMQCFMLLEHLNDKKVVLINGDVLSHKVSKQDRNDFPLIGDGTTIVVVENTKDNEQMNTKIYYELYMDGSRANALKIPAGGFKMPSTQETAKVYDVGDGNLRALDHLHMEGSAVFSFVQQEVPPLVQSLLHHTNKTLNDFDVFLFHQPNKFMLQKLSQKIGIDSEKIPMNLVENYGNLSGACIPMVALHNFKDELKSRIFKTLLCAFGSGLSWCAMDFELGHLEHCEIVETDL